MLIKTNEEVLFPRTALLSEQHLYKKFYRNSGQRLVLDHPEQISGSGNVEVDSVDVRNGPTAARTTCKK